MAGPPRPTARSGERRPPAAAFTPGARRTGGGPVTLSPWARSDQSGFTGEVVDRFNAEHQDVLVELTLLPPGNYVQKLGVAVASGAGPDLTGPDLASTDLVLVPFFASSGVLADITGPSRELPELDRLSEPHLDQGMYQDRRYALPFTGGRLGALLQPGPVPRRRARPGPTAAELGRVRRRRPADQRAGRRRPQRYYVRGLVAGSVT
ncbi:hypothetical protein DEH69_19825 [Streptomyces sp. PT12]|nr:hypothetical protein DEH69_19825 [Streptomyces sp. PT12]